MEAIGNAHMAYVSGGYFGKRFSPLSIILLALTPMVSCEKG